MKLLDLFLHCCGERHCRVAGHLWIEPEFPDIDSEFFKVLRINLLSRSRDGVSALHSFPDFLGLPVDINSAVYDAYSVTGYGDAAFHIVILLVGRTDLHRTEIADSIFPSGSPDHHIIVIGRSLGQHGVPVRKPEDDIITPPDISETFEPPVFVLDQSGI